MSRFAERLAHRYYEGPEPPERLTEHVLAFAAAHPTATRGDWIAFASAFARSSYRAGYVRGVEWVERDLDKLSPESLEVVAHAQAYDFEWHAPEGLTAQQLAEQVQPGASELEQYLDALPDDASRARVLDVLGLHGGNFRVVVTR